MSDIQIVDAEETPQSRQRKKLAKEFHEEKTSKKVVTEWYTLENGKLVQCKVSNTGNLHRIYVGSEKGCKDDIQRLKQEGKLKHSYYKPE